MLVALLSAVLLSGAQRLSCEMHGAELAQTPVGVQTAGHAGMSDMATMPAMVGMSHEGGESAPGDDGDGRCHCTCIGDCTMVAPLASSPATITLRVAVVAPEPARALDREPTRPTAAAPDRLLPFANGPPPSALV